LKISFERQVNQINLKKMITAIPDKARSSGMMALQKMSTLGKNIPSMSINNKREDSEVVESYSFEDSHSDCKSHGGGLMMASEDSFAFSSANDLEKGPGLKDPLIVKEKVDGDQDMEVEDAHQYSFVMYSPSFEVFKRIHNVFSSLPEVVENI